MKLQLVTPSQGLRWIRQGFTVFFIKPSSFALLFGVLMLGVLVLLSLPGVGTLLLMATLPLISLWFSLLTQSVLNHQESTVSQVLQTPFKAYPAGGPISGSPYQHRGALALLGLLQVLAALLIGIFSNWLDGGALQTFFEQTASSTPSSAVITLDQISSQVWLGLWVRLGLAAACSIPLWHAPMLVYWGRYTVPKALFASTVAIWQNRGALTIYVLAWLSLGAAMLTFLQLIAALIGTPALTALLSPSAWLMLWTVFYVSLYFVFADSFVEAKSKSV
jgi:hypothetical protein